MLFLIIFLLAASAVKSGAQEKWSLQKCIEYARTNSISLKQAGNGIAAAKLADRQNTLARLPSANASSSYGYQFGRTIDPTTNSFDNQTIAFNNIGINAGATLYSGGRINNTIKQGKFDILAAEEDAVTAFNNIALNIAAAYLQILQAEEQLDNAVKRRNLSQDQLAQTDKLIQAGTLPSNDRLDVLAQIATNEQSIVQFQNQMDINYLVLKELMQLDPNTDIQIEKPNFEIAIDPTTDNLTFREVYVTAETTQPQIRANDYRVKSAELGVDIARSGFYPTLSVFAGIDTRWSGVSKIYEQTVTTERVSQTFYVDPNEMPFTVKFDAPKVDVNVKDYAYMDQLKDNFGQNIGLSLQVPIYNNGRNSIAVQMAELGILNAQLQNDLTKQQLKNDVQQALANVRAAKRSLEAGIKSTEAAKVAFENAEKRFRLGAINNLQLITARNTFDIAQTNETVAKYDYLFRLKILDFYLGKQIKLD